MGKATHKALSETCCDVIVDFTTADPLSADNKPGCVGKVKDTRPSKVGE